MLMKRWLSKSALYIQRQTGFPRWFLFHVAWKYAPDSHSHKGRIKLYDFDIFSTDVFFRFLKLCQLLHYYKVYKEWKNHRFVVWQNFVHEMHTFETYLTDIFHELQVHIE